MKNIDEFPYRNSSIILQKFVIVLARSGEIFTKNQNIKKIGNFFNVFILRILAAFL